VSLRDLADDSIVINNDGYSIERAIWGPERVYLCLDVLTIGL
jgi:TPP-dependent 2-oxoacid decarboxylase